MKRYFNIEGACHPEEHYMVDLNPCLNKIKNLIDNKKYFSINRSRQFGKTTTLEALARGLKNEYIVVSLDFQMLSHDDFKSESTFVAAFSREVLLAVSEPESIPEEVFVKLTNFAEETDTNRKLSLLFLQLSKWCKEAKKPVVLIIDEVDSATNNQVFLDFLSQLRGYYIHRRNRPAFHSVILAGVYDVKNLKQKIRPEENHKTNSPWNTREGNEPSESLLSFGDCPRDYREFTPYDISTKFDVDMSFSEKAIEKMLEDYEKDYQVGMNIQEMATLIYDYTSGYPFLVSDVCKIIDEQIAGSENFPLLSDAWTKAGFLETVKVMLAEKNTLFESMINKLKEYPELRKMIYEILFQGMSIPYNADEYVTDIGIMFGFLKIENSNVKIANRIFETRFYNFFLAEDRTQESVLCNFVESNKKQFIKNGELDMPLIFESFIHSFHDIYGNQEAKFLEEDGRRYFLLFLRPIINGTGNYYIEAQTRDARRTDVIVDYLGKQYIIELKIWRGEEYNRRGVEQLGDYLDAYHLKKGYMLSFNFNKDKEIGIKEVTAGDKVILEAVV